MTCLSAQQLTQARRAASEFSFDVVFGETLSGGRINEIWLLRTTGGARVLRWSPSTRQLRQVDFEMSVLRHLSERDCAVPRPQNDVHGRSVGIQDGRAFVWTSVCEGQPVSAHAAPFLSPERVAALLHPVFEHLGSFTAPFRPVLETRVMERAVGALVEQLREAQRAGAAQAISTLFADLEEEMRRVSLPSGVIHADIHPGNVLETESGALSLVDFDDAHVGARSLDWVLAALEFSWSEEDALQEERYAELLSVLVPAWATTAEREALPLLRRIHLLRCAGNEAELATPLSDNRYLSMLLPN